MTDWHDSDTNSTMPKEMQYELTSINGWWQSWTIAQDPDQTSSGSARGYGTVPPRRKGLSNDASVSLIEVDIEDAMDRLGMGFFQYQILVAAVRCFVVETSCLILQKDGFWLEHGQVEMRTQRHV